MMLFYCFIGLIYALINIFVRKLEIDDDWMLVLVWIFFWPICFVALTIKYINNKI